MSLFVFGRTGTGKTTLVRSFLDELLEREEAVVLSGRCYERESVPYKALDSLIDSLARYLKGLPPEQVGALLPEDVAFLARAFPVLQSLEAIAAARRLAPAEMPDQQELRRRTFAGLRELLKRLAEQTPLILAIDDLQWGDVDSAHLLSDLICSRQSPALLFIGCFRSEDAEQSPFLLEMRKSMAKERQALEHRELAVEALPLAEARAAGAGPPGPRRCGGAGAGAHGRHRIGRQPALHRRAGAAHPERRADRPLGGDRPARPGRGALDADPAPAGGRPATAGAGRRLGPADPPEPGLPGLRAGRRRARGAGVAAIGAADPVPRASHTTRKSRSTTIGFARRSSPTCRASRFAGTTSGWRWC